MQLENRNAVLLISLLSSTYGNYHHYLLPSKKHFMDWDVLRGIGILMQILKHISQQQFQKTLGINCHTTDPNIF